MRTVSALSVLFAMLLAGTTPALAQPRSPGFEAFDKAVAETKAAIMADPHDALAKSSVALAKAEALPASAEAELARATALWLRSEALIGLNRLQEAEKLVGEALPIVERRAAGTKLHGDVARSRGAVAGLSGNMQRALKDYLAAYQIFGRAKEIRSQAITLQDIGQIYFDAGDYERVIRYYAQAKELYDADPGFALTTHNNLGETLRMLGRAAEAEAEYGAALAKAREMGSAVLEVRILNNLALVQIENRKLDAASRSADHALSLTRTGDAEDWRNFVFGVQAKIAAARGDDARAAALLERTFTGLDLGKTDVIYKEFHELAARIFERLGRPEQALAHLKAYNRLDSETRTLTASASSQLLSARFDFTNQNLRIAQLKQGQLERDVKIERQRSRFRTTLFTGLAIAGAIVLTLVLLAFFSIRRSRNEVRAANSVLTVVNTKLEKALKAKTDFLAMTSHEIRTPLNGILGMTQILLTNRKLDIEMREQVQVVQGAGEAMRALVDDILDVAKMETGKVTVALEEMDFRAVVADVARLWSGHATAKGLTLELDCDRAPSRIRSDPARLRQIIGNLLSNAVKFTGEGGVRLTARADAEAGTLVIAVRDTGIGISPEHHDIVFQSFQQVDGGTTRQFSGTGLGLSICRNLAEALEGTISLESEVGLGATFRLTIPLHVCADEPGGDVLDAGRPVALSAARVLLVESNVLTQAVMGGLLESVVASVRCVQDGAAALIALETGAVDHLLIEGASCAIDDLGPVASLAKVIEAGRMLDIPVTLLLAPADDLPLGDVSALGARLLVKPITGAQLIAALHESYPERPGGTLSAAA